MVVMLLLLLVSTRLCLLFECVRRGDADWRAPEIVILFEPRHFAEVKSINLSKFVNVMIIKL